MPKKKQLYWILFIILALFLIIEIIGLQCSHTPSDDHRSQEKTYQKKDSTGTAIFSPVLGKGINCILDWVGTNNAAVVALATIIIALFTGTLWWATTGLFKTAQEQSRDMKDSIAAAQKAAKAAEDSVKIAKKSLNTTRRAYVFLKDIEIRETQGRGSISAIQGQMRWQLFPRWQNSGDTPTRNLTISVGCKVSDRFLPHNFPFPYTNKELKGLSGDCCYSYDTKRNIPIVIGPKAAIISVPLIISETHDDIARIMSDYLSIYVWGEAKYLDVFDATLTHCTRFFVKLSFPEKFIEQPLLIYYERYTCADEDCG